MNKNEILQAICYEYIQGENKWILQFPAFGEQADTTVTNSWLRSQLKNGLVSCVPLGCFEITEELYQRYEINVTNDDHGETEADMVMNKEAGDVVFVSAIAWEYAYDNFPYPGITIDKAYFRGKTASL